MTAMPTDVTAPPAPQSAVAAAPAPTSGRTAGATPRPFLVMKFGGTSVATAARMRGIADLVAAALLEQRVAVVASALSGVTDLLLAGLREAAVGRPTDAVARYRALHTALAGELAGELGGERFGRLMGALEVLAGELDERLRGVMLLRDCSPRVHAHTVTLGERGSCAVLSALLDARGFAPQWLDPLVALPCSGDPLEATPNTVAMHDALAAVRAGQAAVVLMPGFYGGDAQGQAMCLGRGGSDYSAALLAQALEARRLEIWTDVDGIFTTDPRIAPAARALPRISFEEALELAHFGAKVLHPRTIAPARAAGIPVRICNSFAPERPGTLVEARDPDSTPADVACGLSFLRGVALVSVFGPGMPGVPGVAARIFAAMAQHDISVILITQGSSETALSFCVRGSQAEEAAAALRTAFEAEIALGRVEEIAVRRELSIVSLVGDGMREHAGVAGRFFGALGEAGVNVAAIAQGASERSISAVVSDADGERAVRAAHRRFFEHTRRLDLLLAGKGVVAGALLELLEQECAPLRRRGIELRLLAVAGRDSLALDGRGLAPAGARAALRPLPAGAGVAAALLQAAREHRGGPAVLVDCTSAPDVAALYPDLLRSGVHVATASKLANSAPLDRYRELRAAATAGGSRFLYSANVGGGLPVISALRRLQAGGDRVERFAGIASGSLSFLLGQLEDGVPFSAAVRDARERGFTEPDPRDDLSGLDVARKVLILAREAGLDLELEDIEVTPALPDGWDAGGSVDEFLARLPEIDAWFAQRIGEARERGEVLRFVGGFERGSTGATARAGLASLGADHPLQRVRDGENAFSFWSAHYQPQPLVLSGYGAGGRVTAAAVLADVVGILEGGTL